nr:alkaline phosphatase PhoX [Halomonas elongata]
MDGCRGRAGRLYRSGTDSLGTPLNSQAPSWSEDLGFTPEIQANSVGMHHDGMHNFALDEKNASRNFLLALNNEYIDQGALWAPQGGRPMPPTGLARPMKCAPRSMRTVSPSSR